MTLEVQAAGAFRRFQHMAAHGHGYPLAAGLITQRRFGTGLAQALRIYADSLRMKRRWISRQDQ